MKEGECAMETRPNLPDQQTGLNSIEIDTIGEVLNISMGAAATAVSILLNRQVSITTPNVQIVHSSEFEFSELEPALGVEIKYIQGLFGSNHMIMSVRDVRAIVQLLLGDAGELSSVGGAELDEIHVSALGEVMNQMMGASCTALASFLDREINISPPVPFEISSMTGKTLWSEEQDYIVAVGFKLTIEDLVDSEFFTVMPVPFARELVGSAMGISGQEMLQEETEISQVTGHTQIPAPVIGDDYQAAAKAAPKPAPAAAPNPAPAAAPKPAPAPAPKPAPAAAPMPAPTAAPAAPPMTVPAAVAASAPMAADPVPMAMPYPAPMAANPAPMAMPGPVPMAAPRPAPRAGYPPERPMPHQNVVVKPLQFGSLDTENPFAEEMDNVNLGLVMGVDLNVTVEIGRARKQVKEILSLHQGSIVELDKQAGAPVDIMVNGKLIARGDVVVIDDNFGVRITEIVSSAAQR